MIFGIDAPCKCCEERMQGCHASCKKYSDYTVRLGELKQKQEQEKDFEKFIAELGKNVKKIHSDRLKKNVNYKLFRRF